VAVNAVGIASWGRFIPGGTVLGTFSPIRKRKTAPSEAVCVAPLYFRVFNRAFSLIAPELTGVYRSSGERSTIRPFGLLPEFRATSRGRI
jgi:hypothetical protein